jgi:hypothetical protein
MISGKVSTACPGANTEVMTAVALPDLEQARQAHLGAELSAVHE